MREPFNAASWLLDRHVDEGRGRATAVVCGSERLSYEDLLAASYRAARALAALGVRPEDRVPLVLEDGSPFLAMFLGAMRMGAVPIPLSTMLTAPELGQVVGDSRARIVVISAAYADHLDGIAEGAPELTDAVVVGEADRAPRGRLAVCGWDDFEDDSPVETYPTWSDSPGFWLYTSGTTGSPKGAMHRHGSLRATAETYARSVLAVTGADRFYSVAKLFFAFGLGNSLTFPLFAGATTVLDPARPTPSGAAEVLIRHQPTLFCASPGFLAALLDAEVPPEAFASVRCVVTAGESLPAELYRRFVERYNVPTLDGIGTTEILHIFLSNRLGAERPGTSGTPVEGYEAKLVDADGATITEADHPGSLYVRGESIMTGYWCDIGATRAALHGEWIRTGDVYTVSSDGYWSFHGRANDMMKVGGIWVSPAEVENVLLGHPDVLEAAVVGSHTGEGLETEVAFVVPRAGHTIDIESVDAHCRAHMASFKRPRVLMVVDELPKTATGKVQRFALRNLLATKVADAPDGLDVSDVADGVGKRLPR
ncbi:MAG: benzoate-CoA ligase family protein [Acidimicrobiales bacterium]